MLTTPVTPNNSMSVLSWKRDSCHVFRAGNVHRNFIFLYPELYQIGIKNCPLGIFEQKYILFLMEEKVSESGSFWNFGMKFPELCKHDKCNLIINI